MSYNDQAITGDVASAGGMAVAQDEVLMPQVPKGMLPGLLRVEVQILAADFSTASDNFDWSLSPKSQDAVLTIGDPDAICADSVELITAVGTIEYVRKYDFPAPMLISYTKLYFQCASTQAGTISYRIHWVPRSSKTPQRDNVVSQTQF